MSRSIAAAAPSAQYKSPFAVVNDFLGEAPVDLEGMARALGLEVHMDADLPDDVSGRIKRLRGMRGDRFVIEVNGAHPSRRRRFTLAHEIAHYLLHQDLFGDSLEDSEMYRSGLPEPVEYEANRYAADLLMPANLVRTLFRAGVKSLNHLSDAFDVSEGALRIRLKQLRLDA
ncbi:ImmA/IrrE family metallo-endopeptidase [Roseomonas gilardii]|uniref:ImmA/IrrE family metallo-endopeptidase n=1 Tax=Roseomonas gilardii TaxID=257708 RepID=A0ABU3MBE2_9PROT|nr:ImmA/IrrE family metallo-endopeptidase [Roseomonas gilardii]MDT8330167.1 ImmA/IrrE family metallo-endopeptidase [Roseomonas gilardii]